MSKIQPNKIARAQPDPGTPIAHIEGTLRNENRVFIANAHMEALYEDGDTGLAAIRGVSGAVYELNQTVEDIAVQLPKPEVQARRDVKATSMPTADDEQMDLRDRRDLKKQEEQTEPS